MIRDFDEVVCKFWLAALGEPGPLDAQRTQQMHLPTRIGGLGSGAIQFKADDAFLAGSLAALPEVLAATASGTVEEMRRKFNQYPR